MSFGQRLRELRNERGENQSILAEKLGVSGQSYSAYENGREPPYSILCAIAKYFGVTTDYLLGLTDARKSENASIVNETGLTELAIRTIKRFSSNNAANYLPPSTNDTRTLLDLLNLVITHPKFRYFLQSLAILSNPEAEELSGIEWSTEGEIKVPLSYIAKDLANKLVDEMAQGLKEVYAKQLQNTKGTTNE